MTKRCYDRKMKDKERIDYTKDLSIDGLKGKDRAFSVDQQDENRKVVVEKLEKTFKMQVRY